MLGVKFFSGSFERVASDHALLGGLVVAPSGPGLANDLPRDPAYRDALFSADLVLPDSGLMALWWNRFHSNEKEKLPRLSGLLFLKELIKREAKGVLSEIPFGLCPMAAKMLTIGDGSLKRLRPCRRDQERLHRTSVCRCGPSCRRVFFLNFWWNDGPK